ncbi:oxidoreductase [Flaviramulus sp. BrNp1-15]|uniref:WD40/YVTN/BNR-like repeat-containing protein n=1 Tax=Flaviramulus sp. BrNp1-15 TaxID=2916754 RepID=UPI001EE7C8D5|nr:oxidoreductase [Flaviramulus sp. BrNp1-15]ULC58882.1 oxidoreductase [Flaviramulus sp. BrNp1-15]
MKHTFYIILLLPFFLSCGKKERFKPRNYVNVEIKTLLQDSLLNVRALEVDKNGVGIFASSKGDLGFIHEERFVDVNINHKEELRATIFRTINFNKDSIPNFRSIARTKKQIFAFGIGSPAVLFRISEDTVWPIIYQENHPKAFYDSMDFWNDQEGIAIGDSTDGCLSVIITRDGGNTWTKVTCDQLPKGTENEGAFAASDTNIAIVGDNTWVATTAGRVYYSPDKGKTWKVFDTPIVKDEETQGIYSIDFYDELNGFAIGGDYTKPDDNAANKIKTIDGGKTWQLVGQNQNPGYRSCVQYIPNRNGKELVAVGFKGIDFSNDAGETWKHLSDEGFYTIRFLNDSIAYAAGAGRISKLTFRE